MPDIQHNLGKLLGEAGFVNIYKKTVAVPRLGQDPDLEYSEYEGHKRLMTAFSAAAKQSVLDTGQFESEGEYDMLLKGVKEE